MLPRNYFSGLTLDAPLALEFSTGSGINISGTVTDPDLDRIRFSFRPIEDGDEGNIDFYFNVFESSFNRDIFIGHSRSGTYKLLVYTEKEGGGIARSGWIEPIRITKGSGPFMLPRDFFQFIFLERPFVTEVPVDALFCFKAPWTKMSVTYGSH